MLLQPGQGSNEKDTDVLFAQLKLALTWDRSDVAEEKIFNKDISWPDGETLRDSALNKIAMVGKVLIGFQENSTR